VLAGHLNAIDPELNHKDYQWKVNRCYKHIQSVPGSSHATRQIVNFQATFIVLIKHLTAIRDLVFITGIGGELTDHISLHLSRVEEHRHDED